VKPSQRKERPDRSGLSWFSVTTTIQFQSALTRKNLLRSPPIRQRAGLDTQYFSALPAPAHTSGNLPGQSLLHPLLGKNFLKVSEKVWESFAMGLLKKKEPGTEVPGFGSITTNNKFSSTGRGRIS
jgi:hypothetical protein